MSMVIDIALILHPETFSIAHPNPPTQGFLRAGSSEEYGSRW